MNEKQLIDGFDKDGNVYTCHLTYEKVLKKLGINEKDLESCKQNSERIDKFKEIRKSGFVPVKYKITPNQTIVNTSLLQDLYVSIIKHTSSSENLDFSYFFRQIEKYLSSDFVNNIKEKYSDELEEWNKN